MNEKVVGGIKEDGLRDLSVEVLDCADRISELFDKIDTCMDKLPSCYRGSSCAELINRYREISATYPTIKNNVKGYSDDFVALLQKMREGDQSMAKLFQGYTEDTTKQIQSVKDNDFN